MKKTNLFPLLLTDTQRDYITAQAERKSVSKAEIIRRLIDEDMDNDILAVAQKVNERIIIQAESETETNLSEYLLNEFGKFIYDVNLNIKHYPTPADTETGWQAGFETTDVSVELLKIYDTEGELVPFTKEQKKDIEETFKKLEYEIV